MCMFLDSWRKTGELEGHTCRMGKHMSTWPRIERTTFWLIDKENQNQVKHKWPASHIIASIASRIASHSTVVIFTLANVYISMTKMFQMSYISDYSGSVNVLMWGKEEELSLASFCLIYWSWGWTAALKKKQLKWQKGLRARRERAKETVIALNIWRIKQKLGKHRGYCLHKTINIKKFCSHIGSLSNLKGC